MTDFWHILPAFQLATDSDETRPLSPYKMSGTTAIIPLVGPTSKFGGWNTTSTMQVREQVRAAAEDSSVESVMFYIDSPGGQVSGNRDLARDVSSLAAIKPTHAYGADMIASAAYEVASQTGRVFANESAFIGSIGTMSALYDTSRLADNMGVKVHQVTSGGLKGMGAFGTEIKPEHVAYQQNLVTQLNDQFVQAVAAGRNMSVGSIRQLADGRVHLAADAASLGLIDGVAPLEQAIEDLQSFSSSQRIFSMYSNTESGNPAGLSTPMSAPTQPALVPVQSVAPVAQPPVAAPAPVQAEAVPAAPEPKAATIAEIKAACPGCSAEFVLAQVEANATLQSVQTSFIAELVQTNAALQATPAPAPAPAAAVPAAAPAAALPGNQPVVPEPEAVEEAFAGGADEFFNSELEKEKHFLREGNPRLDAHSVHSRAVFNVYSRHPDLREARLSQFNPVPVRAPKAPSA